MLIFLLAAVTQTPDSQRPAVGECLSARKERTRLSGRAREQAQSEAIRAFDHMVFRLRHVNAKFVAYPGQALLPPGLPNDFAGAFATIRFTLQANGRASDCSVDGTTGIAGLDSASCGAILPHIVSQPAVRGGRIVSQIVHIGVRWSPPPERYGDESCNADGGAILIGGLSEVPSWTFYDLHPANGSAVRLRLALSATGMPKSCTIVEAVATADLTDRVCEVAMRLRFLPATDPEGRTIATTVDRVIAFNGFRR